MFLNFLYSFGFKEKVISTHSLMSAEFIKKALGDVPKEKNVILSYYTKQKGKIDAGKIEQIIPREISDISDIVLWFDLYDLEPKIIKDSQGNFLKIFSDPWKLFMEKFKKAG